jgi:hypothetical protein
MLMVLLHACMVHITHAAGDQCRLNQRRVAASRSQDGMAVRMQQHGCSAQDH